jgi:hypothetical protein
MYTEPLYIEILEVLASGCAGVAIVAAILAGCWLLDRVGPQ